jgi:hypothetical protein
MFETDASGMPVMVDALDDAALLALLTDADAQERRASRAKLRLAHRWCVLHPATADSGAATWGDAGLPGLVDCDEPLGGEGTPLVAAFTPEPFAAALGVTTNAGMQLLADALDLAYRLPRLWARVEALEIPAWQARRVAQETTTLSQAAATYVDEQLASRSGGFGWPTIERVVAFAVARFHPDRLATKERSARERWDVTLSHPTMTEYAGTSTLEAVGDTYDLTRFYDLVCEQAAQLKALGDTDPLGVRKAKALGVIADQQPMLPLAPAAASRADLASLPLPKTKLYLHLEAADLGAGDAVGEAERLGPVTVAKIKEWVGHSRVTIQPVLDGARDDTADAHDPPAWMRELVTLRDTHCVFPHCRRTSRRCDLDHVIPYDDTGPPGQTSPANLAPLCRRHHRAKTLGRWRYRRDPGGHYQWRDPTGRGYVVTRDGTVSLT